MAATATTDASVLLAEDTLTSVVAKRQAEEKCQLIAKLLETGAYKDLFSGREFLKFATCVQ